MDVTRTVKVPNTIYTLTSTLAAGVHTLTWAPAPTTQPAHLPDPRHGGRPRGQPRRLRGRQRVRRPRAARRRRPRAGHRRGLRPAELRAGRGGAHPHRHRRTVAHRCASSARAPSRSSPTPTTRWPASTSGRRRRRSTGRCTAASRGSISFRIPNVPSGLYYAQFDARRRPGRLRAVRRPPGGARGDRPRARHPADEHLAGLQLPGRRRQRLRRHVVRRAAEPRRRPRRARTSRAASRRASTATTCRSCTGCSGPARAPSSSPIPTSTRSRTATTSRVPTTWSSSRDTRST